MNFKLARSRFARLFLMLWGLAILNSVVLKDIGAQPSGWLWDAWTVGVVAAALVALLCCVVMFFCDLTTS